MNTILYSRSFATTAMMGMVLIMASIISVAPELLKQTAIATVGQGNTTTTTTPTEPNNATQRVSVGGGNVTFSVNQFSPQITEIQPGESVTFFAPNGSIEPHNVIFDLRSEEHTSELQSRQYLVCRLLLEKKKNK